VQAKVLRLKTSRQGKKGSSLETVVVPGTFREIQAEVDRCWPKAEPTIVYLANRNTDGVSPEEWYSMIVEALGFDSTLLLQARASQPSDSGSGPVRYPLPSSTPG